MATTGPRDDTKSNAGERDQGKDQSQAQSSQAGRGTRHEDQNQDDRAPRFHRDPDQGDPAQARRGAAATKAKGTGRKLMPAAETKTSRRRPADQLEIHDHDSLSSARVLDRDQSLDGGTSPAGVPVTAEGVADSTHQVSHLLPPSGGPVQLVGRDLSCRGEYHRMNPALQRKDRRGRVDDTVGPLTAGSGLSPGCHRRPRGACRSGRLGGPASLDS